MSNKHPCHESKNIIQNIRAISLDSGRGVTNIEAAAGCSSGTLCMADSRNSSFTLQTALKLSKAVNVNLMDLMKEPEEFRKEFLN